jgi:hypothetical protein
MNSQPVQKSKASNGLAAKVGQFFSDQAKLSLFVLMLLAGLVIGLTPIAWTYGHSYTAAASTGSSSPTKGGAPNQAGGNNRCNQILVSFASTATIAQIADLLQKLDANIAFGPNENGAYELAVVADSAVAVVAALNRAEALVVVASLRERCL